MNEVKKQNINEGVSSYLLTKDEAQLTEIYEALRSEYKAKLAYWSASTYMANEHDLAEMFDAVFLTALDSIGKKGEGDFVKLFSVSLHNRYKDLLRKLKVRRNFEQYDGPEDESESSAATFEIVDDFDLEEAVISKKKNDQRQLIEFLVNGENPRTTAIVQAYLSTDLKTPTAIGNHLGLDHKQVSRALNRLAGKFSTKQFGDYRDFLVAL